MRHAKGLSSYRIYSPRLETLEDRLPPGDALLGVLWGMELMAPDVGWPGLSLRSPGTVSGMADRGVEDSAPATPAESPESLATWPLMWPDTPAVVIQQSTASYANDFESLATWPEGQEPMPARDTGATSQIGTMHQPAAPARASVTGQNVTQPLLAPRPIGTNFFTLSAAITTPAIHPAFAAVVSRGGHANGPTAGDDVLTPGKESVGKLYRPDPPPGSRVNTIYVDDDTCPSTGDGSAGNPYCKIQDGLNAAANGDTILVADGAYVENLVAPNGIDFTLQSANGPEVTVIDGSGAIDSVIKLSETGQTVATIVGGFRITGGSGKDGDFGGGIYLRDVGATLRNNVFAENAVSIKGGGIYATGITSVTAINIHNCIIVNNSVTGITSDGGGIYASDNALALRGTTLHNNSAPDKGDAVFVSGAGSMILENSIIHNNGGPGDSNEVYMESGTNNIAYTDIEGGTSGVTGSVNWGPGILNVDPKFVNPSAGDYHLKPGSPVINKGDPAYTGVGETDIDGDPRVLYGRIDLGADEAYRARPTPADADPVGPPTAVP